MMDIQEIKKKKSTEELLEFGILKMDKPSGKTSFDISNYVKKNLRLKKTSHFGTLDPQVTGVLPVGLNRACKLTGFFIGEEKEYIGIMRIHEEISLDKIKEKIDKEFVGKIKQTPPLKSSVKRQPREREIKKFNLLEKDGKDILFQVLCQGGTYIRKLIDDLGKSLEVGMHMLELRRTGAGIFKEEDEFPIVKTHDLDKAIQEYREGNDEKLREMIIPAEIVQRIYSPIEIKEDRVEEIFTGKPIYKKDLVKDTGVKKESTISVFCEDRFIGMFKVIRGKEIFAVPKFVMQPVKN